MVEFELSDNALHVLEARYLRRDAAGHVVESPLGMFERVARAVAEGELGEGSAAEAARWESEYLDMLTALDFLPNSPTLMNAGLPLGQLSACFVLPVEDSMESIFEALKQMALIQRTGGGTGFSFSRLRRRGESVASTGGEASGPVSFMKIFDCATEHVKQGGKRRGANMGILRVDHPDVMEFIACKLDGKSLSNFNISVGVTDRFMDAVRRDMPYDLVNPGTGRPVGKMSARRVLLDMAGAAWRTGDPGLVFLDAINRRNPTPQLGPIEATNPCGEIPLLPHESCNLGSINLLRMIRKSGGQAAVDLEKLRKTVARAVRFLDDVITVSRYPLPEVEAVTRGNRKIGLGVMGFADMLIHLGIPYGSRVALSTAGRLMHFISETALDASRQLAGVRGVFPNWKGSIYEARKLEVRNATRTAIAPTGTISIIADASAGIEPLFALAYRRSHVLSGETLHEVSPVLRQVLEAKGLDAGRVIESVLKNGRLGPAPGIPEKVRRLFVTALDLSPEQHIRMQAAFQRHVDNSVSKTVNLPAGASAEDIARAYVMAWELGLKGITVYRYGSKEEQVLELGIEEEPHPTARKLSCAVRACDL
ncbi:MAG: adenosylcobalamin-dependent ribonucleoside-diphosphate reductase [Syntrophobacteraceae bacterium]|nr:adenosylcobalamin-dependent ribonucleoside-diphosphate reductase [Desulfobacteraceae bacterium]